MYLRSYLLILFLFMCLGSKVCAQKGHLIKTGKIVIQTPRVNGTIRGNTNATSNARKHANSNSIFGTSTTHPMYDKKKQAKTHEAKTGELLKPGKDKAMEDKKKVKGEKKK